MISIDFRRKKARRIGGLGPRDICPGKGERRIGSLSAIGDLDSQYHLGKGLWKPSKWGTLKKRDVPLSRAGNYSRKLILSMSNLIRENY